MTKVHEPTHALQNTYRQGDVPSHSKTNSTLRLSPSAAVWDVRVLLVREGSTYDLPELHSSPWSSVQLLQATDRRARDFLLPQQVRTGNSSSVELDLDTLLSQKYSGDWFTSSYLTNVLEDLTSILRYIKGL